MQGSMMPTIKERKEVIRGIINKAYSEKRRILLEHESKKIIQNYQVPVTRENIAHTLDDAVRISERIGFPIVLKISSPEILHKSDVGGIITGLRNASEVKEAYNRIIRNVSEKGKRKSIQGILIQEMILGGNEVIIGATRDPHFGPVVMFGLGGVFVELLDDVSFRLAPFSKDEAMEMIRETRAFKVLGGFRNQKSVDFEHLANILTFIGKIVVDFPEIAEVDVNPLIANENGVTAVDARIILV
jgi:acetyl-CoA synthetase (ADP-forming)